MQPNTRPKIRWSTSAYGDTPSPSPAEMAELAAHVRECRRARGRMFSLRSKANAMNDIFAHRFWTTITAVALLLLFASLVFAG